MRETLLYSATDPMTGVRSSITINDDLRARVINRIGQRETQMIADQCQREREFWARLSLREKNKARRYGTLVGHVPVLLWAIWRREWDTYFRSYCTWQEFEINKLNSEEFGEYRCTHEKIPMPVSARARAENQIDAPLLGAQADQRRRNLMVAVARRDAAHAA